MFMKKLAFGNVERVDAETLARIIRRANAFARRKGHGTATHVLVFNGPQSKNKIVDSTRSGYRKHTTGEYVPNAYLRNFGHKNTYYQNAVTVVAVGIDRATMERLKPNSKA